MLKQTQMKFLREIGKFEKRFIINIYIDAHFIFREIGDKIEVIHASVLEDIDLNWYTKGNEASTELNKTKTSDNVVKLDIKLGDYLW